MTRTLFLIAVSTVALANVAAAQEQVFKVANTTPNCRDGSRATHQVCLPEGKVVRAPPTINITSKAGNRADIESQGPVPGKPNCWEIVTVVQPAGETCIKAPFLPEVCNCKGRGWIDLEVRLTPQ
jgi:hypothetical protein